MDDFIVDSITFDSDNKEFKYALECVQYTNQFIYLTGKAGTGKTTFLKYLRKVSNKKLVVLAPTGVAAVNAKGQTIHSFFHIPFSIFIPNDPRLTEKFYETFRYNDTTKKMMRELELLVIDEVSMVRCDLLDVVDVILRTIRGKNNIPFGGVQILLIGDTFQLPPVVKPEEWCILQKFYESEFFFSSKVMAQIRLLYIELKKVYRQKEKDFIDLLNRIRVGKQSSLDIEMLNSRYCDEIDELDRENQIILTSTNADAEFENSQRLEALPSKMRTFNAEITGDFPEKYYPTDSVLELKEGAQVIFLRNNWEKGIFNGKIGTVARFEKGIVVVDIVNDLNESVAIDVEPEIWENFAYTWNDDENTFEETVTGTFKQFPLKLAWAITVHKSQGMTFEKVIADIGYSFAAGQVYVALSRCTSINGLVLKTKLTPQAIKTDPRVIAFSEKEISETLLHEELQKGKADYYYEAARKCLKTFDADGCYNNFVKAIEYRNDIGTDVFRRFVNVWIKRAEIVKERSQKSVPSNIIEINCETVFEETDNFRQNSEGEYDSVFSHELFYKLQICAIHGDKRCQNQLGLWYEMGIGVEQDFENARKWYLESIKQDYPSAYYNLGLLYFTGKGVEKDLQKSIKYYTKGADLGHIDCQQELGLIYFRGIGVKKNSEKAIYWLNKSIEQNDSWAQYNLGILYLKGIDVAKDVIKGIELLKAASQNGYIKAYRQLGDCYRNGIGVGIDMSSAIQYYTKAGMLDDKNAIVSLIEIFEKKEYKNLFNNEQFDVFVRGVHLGMTEISRITKFWINKEPERVVKGNLVYDSGGLRVIKVQNRYDITDGKLLIDPKTRVICDNASNDCLNLKTIVLPSSINFIGEWAFKGCANLNIDNLPDSIIYLGDRSFDCEEYVLVNKREEPFKVTIPPSVEMIEGNPFCYNSILYCKSEHFKVVGNVLFSADGKVLISYCSPNDEYVVPNGVERIGVGAFRDRPIKRIKFPETLKTIDKQAFKGARELECPSFPKSLLEIGEDAFEWCDFNTGILSFSYKIEKIAANAFGFGWYIKLIKIPYEHLESYRRLLPKHLSNQIYAGEYIYENNLYLTDDRTEIIAARAGIKQYVVPEGVRSIRDNAFDSIYAIDSIQFPATLKNLTINVFDKELYELKTILVPKGTKELYVEIFSNFKCRIIEY